MSLKYVSLIILLHLFRLRLELRRVIIPVIKTRLFMKCRLVNSGYAYLPWVRDVVFANEWWFSAEGVFSFSHTEGDSSSSDLMKESPIVS